MLAGIIVKINNVFVELLSYLTLSRWGTVGFAKIQNEVAVPKPIINYKQEMIGDSMIVKPVPEISSTEDTSALAYKEISKNFWPENKDFFIQYQNDSNLEFFIVGIIAIVFFIALFLALKDKDSIAIHG